MKTKVIMKRSFMGSEISQQSDSGMFSATDLVKIVNKKRLELDKPAFNFSAYLKSKSTLEFIEQLQESEENVIIRSKGKNKHTWVHPFLFIDIALQCDPKLKIKVYSWLYDELIKYRNDSGDSYKKMSGSLYISFNNNREFPKFMIKVANYIKKKMGVEDWNKATEEQLKLRDKIHDNISLLTDVLKDPKQAVRLGVDKALNNP